MNTNLDFEQVTAITNDPLFIIAMIIVWFLPILIYLIMGSVVRGKTSSGVPLKKPMIGYANFWYGFFLWFFLQAGLILILVIFPLYLKII